MKRLHSAYTAKSISQFGPFGCFLENVSPSEATELANFFKRWNLEGVPNYNAIGQWANIWIGPDIGAFKAALFQELESQLSLPQEISITRIKSTESNPSITYKIEATDGNRQKKAHALGSFLQRLQSHDESLDVHQLSGMAIVKQCECRGVEASLSAMARESAARVGKNGSKSR